MTLTIDITGMPAERCVFAPSPHAELTSMLHVLAEPAHHPAAQAWAAATLAGLQPALADRLLEAEFLGRSSRAPACSRRCRGDILDVEAVGVIN
ncbi:hypothetical protein Daura_41480 [Dactylosporangium aurantiacum]|uniref:DUF5937 domain-containing protein n=1 Tax=Dactylosporangium aurantiacum TaxID=35754 RepID=A0A9Q9II19_9ACTN|nr:DUF5937 family protein [Dactylosporangium aurantiacum]MDG6102747.1 DUF5937 family protein [Dactylosporangium aurantiacum]UWZ53010.1 hypothetical protein Daura_41480 [Dactylosporangium aurantiacum]